MNFFIYHRSKCCAACTADSGSYYIIMRFAAKPDEKTTAKRLASPAIMRAELRTLQKPL